MHGYPPKNAVVVQETNNVVVWLRPHQIIAKVGRWRHSAESLAREHAVAVALSAAEAPIARPVTEAAPAIEGNSGLVVTLWHRLEIRRGGALTPAQMGESLRILHAHLDGYEGELPGFEADLTRARTGLDDDDSMAALSFDDRATLRSAIDRLLPQVRAHPSHERTLHGEPHGGNLLATPAGLRWIDLEAVCRGPIEWDLSFLPDDAVRTFPSVDRELLGLLRTLNSARVATWCWTRAEIDEMRRHGEYHLARVRRAQQRDVAAG
jgi:Ser/Thr protein kinase RdoA (MazF antagonist)